MRAPTTLLRSLLPSRWLQPRATATVAPLPIKSQFDEQLTAELSTLLSQFPHDQPKFSSASGLIQLLDVSIAAQRIALDMFAKISRRDHEALEYCRTLVDEHLETNVDILDACNYFMEKIDMIKKFVNSLRLMARWVDLHSGAKPNEMSLHRALYHLQSCQEIQRKLRVMGKRGSCLIRRMLRRKRSQEYESELSEVMCGSEAMALMACRFLEIGLSFDSKRQSKSPMKVKSQCHHDHEPTSSSWLRLLQEMSKQAAERVQKLRTRRSGNLMMIVMSELKQTVYVAMDLKEETKGEREKEVNSCGDEGLKRCLRELEDRVNVIEGRIKDLYRSLIDVRMALLGMIPQV